jgi:hypothetical protein
MGSWCRRVGDIPSRTSHLRSASQEVFDGHEGGFAAKVNRGEAFVLRLSTYLTLL